MRRVKALSVLLVTASLLAGVPTRVIAVQFCMSDGELRAYLADVALYRWNISGKICLIRHFEGISHYDGFIKEKWKSALLNIERASAPIALTTKHDALEPFRRAFPGKHDEALKIFIESAVRAAREYAAKATQSQCDRLMDFFLAVSQRIETTIETEISSVWDAERLRVERCL
jgi:hypothetical protein